MVLVQTAVKLHIVLTMNDTSSSLIFPLIMKVSAVVFCWNVDGSESDILDSQIVVCLNADSRLGRDTTLKILSKLSNNRTEMLSFSQVYCFRMEVVLTGTVSFANTTTFSSTTSPVATLTTLTTYVNEPLRVLVGFPQLMVTLEIFAKRSTLSESHSKCSTVYGKGYYVLHADTIPSPNGDVVPAKLWSPYDHVHTKVTH